MKELSWKEAFDIAVNYEKENKVTLIVFVDDECPVCGEFVKYLPEIENDNYQVVLVRDGRKMPFTLTSYPMAYVYIPKCPTEMPLQRIGNAPVSALKTDSTLQIKAMKEQRDYAEVRDDYRKQRSKAET